MKAVFLCLCFFAAVFSVNAAIIIGHRGSGCSIPGCMSDIPENSFSAHYNAIKSGVKRMELDVWLTTDNQLPVIHGGAPSSGGDMTETVVGTEDILLEHENWEDLVARNLTNLREPWSTWKARETGKSIPTLVAEFKKLSKANKVKEIDNYKANCNKAVEKMVTLDELFGKLCPIMIPKGVTFQVELKGAKAELGKYVLRVLRAYPGCASGVSSFQWVQNQICLTEKALDMPVDVCPNGRVTADLLKPFVGSGVDIRLLFGLGVPAKDTLMKYMDAYDADGAHIEFNFYKKARQTYPHDPKSINEVVSFLREQGKNVMFWFPGHYSDSASQIHTLLDSCPHGICTNRFPVGEEVNHEYGSECIGKP